MIEHLTVEVNGARLHVARAGSGRPLLLLHGWPEFWLTWKPVMARLAGRFALVAPDLRGFGASDKPAGDFGAGEHAADVAALVGALGLAPVGIVAHDVGASVAQALARREPELIAGLFFFNFLHPGVGDRLLAPDHLPVVWHTVFNASELATALVGATPESTRQFFAHFLRRWAHRPEAFDDAALDAFVANFQAPGNVDGGFSYYRAAAAQRGRERSAATPPAPIALPTCVRWAERDPALPPRFADRLPEFFTDLDVAPFPDVGHFPHREDPDRAAEEIAAFFARLDGRRHSP